VFVLTCGCQRTLGQGTTATTENIPNRPAEGWAWEQYDISLSEICPVPRDQFPTWVELYNQGQQSVDIKGWCLADKSGRVYLFRDDVPPVPPEGIVLVVFQGPSSPQEDDKDFEGDNLAVLYSRTQNTANAVRRLQNECALYTGENQRAEEMVDYVCWGGTQGLRNAERAIQAVLWKATHANPVMVVSPGAPGDGPGLEPGGSISRILFDKPELDAATGRVKKVPSRDWSIWPPRDVTPGEANILPAPLADILSGHMSSERGTALGWRLPDAVFTLADPENWAGHIQVGTDPELRNLVVDAHSHSPYHHTPSLGPGKYYWRVRLENGPLATAWSAVIEFELDP